MSNRMNTIATRKNLTLNRSRAEPCGHAGLVRRILRRVADTFSEEQVHRRRDHSDRGGQDHLHRIGKYSS